MPSSSGKAIKANLLTRCRELYPGAMVTYGLPGTDKANDIVCIGEAGTADTSRGEQEARTLSTNRSREETVYVSLLISSWRGTQNQQLVTELAFDAMALLEADLRSDPTIAGACRESGVVDWRLTETEFDDLAEGRYAQLDITVRCKTRI